MDRLANGGEFSTGDLVGFVVRRETSEGIPFFSREKLAISRGISLLGELSSSGERMEKVSPREKLELGRYRNDRTII